MRVLIAIPSFYPAVVYGGPIFSTFHACEELSKLGVKISVATTNANGNTTLDVPVNTFIEFNKNFRVKYYKETIIGKFSFSLLCSLWKDIRETDVVHIQAIFSTPVPIALFYSIVLKKPILLSPRGALGTWCLERKSSFLKKIWLKIFIKSFSGKIFWHATSCQELLEIRSIIQNAQGIVIPNGLPNDLIKKNNLSLDAPDFHNEKKGKIIVTMGRLHEKKGIDILIKAFDRILQLFPDSHLMIAGQDDGAETALRKLVLQLGLDKHVTFLGHIENEKKYEFLSKADLFVLPSYNENFGNVYAEALAVGTPIVASLNTPWQEIEGAGCGHWVQNSVEDTSNAMIDLLNQDREKLRRNAINYVKNYNWENIAKEFLTLYTELYKKKL